MVVFVCNLCGYEYNIKEGDTVNGIEPDTDFDDLPADWTCPYCGAGKEEFEQSEIADDEDSEDY